MIRNYHNHKPQTTLWHREEEPFNHHETPGGQIKQSNQLSLPDQDDCNTRTDTKQRTTKHRTITDSHNGSNNKQKVNNNRTTALERILCFGIFCSLHHILTDSNFCLTSQEIYPRSLLEDTLEQCLDTPRKYLQALLSTIYIS